MKITRNISFILYAVFSVCIITVCSDSIESIQQPERSLSSDDLLLILTLDGYLTAVDAHNGQIKWRFKEAPVLASSRDTLNGFTFIPNPRDGQLYTLENAKLGKFPFTVPQLVKASPSKSSRGVLYAGSKKDVWISINPRTGDKIDALPPPTINSFCPISYPETVYIGRVEYHLQMLDSKNRKRIWNVTYTDYSSHLLPAETQYPFIHYTLSNSGEIMTINTITRKVQWKRDFQGIVVNLYLLKNDGLHRLPNHMLDNTIFEAVYQDAIFASKVENILRNPFNDDVERNGLLKSLLFIGESATGLFAAPVIVQTSTSTTQKYIGPRVIDDAVEQVPVVVDSGSIVAKPQIATDVPVSLVTHKTVQGEYLLLGYHDSPVLVMKDTLQVTDPNSFPMSNPYQYIDYQNDHKNGETHVCVGAGCKLDNKWRMQKPLKLPEVEDKTMNFNTLMTMIWSEYPQIILATLTAIFGLSGAVFYMMGRYNGAVSVHLQSREASRTSEAKGTDSSKSRFRIPFFQNNSADIFVDEANDSVSVPPGWRKIGKIVYDPKSVLGEGCEGTFVYKGRFDNRDAAVKRVLINNVTLAEREVGLLREADMHPNVIRYFCSEADHNFQFIAFELCDCSLKEYVLKPDVQRNFNQLSDVDLLRQTTDGLIHLHNNNIVHRDVKPQNVLLSRTINGNVRVLISDFGLCKKIKPDHASFSRRSGLAGTDGWIAPEAFKNESSTTKVDIFSLGCLYFYVLTGGKHPFGDSIRRQDNIVRGEYNLGQLLVKSTSFNIAALNVIESMIHLNPRQRPKLQVVLAHPMFWSNERQLQFFMDVSDRIEKIDEDSDVVQRLERCGDRATNNWLNEICIHLREDLRKFRSYKGNSVRDLLRAMRNKKHHYHELPPDVKNSFGEMPNEYVQYWTKRFPRLLMHIYNAMICCAEESVFFTYYPIEAHSFCNRRLEEELNNDFIMAGSGQPLRQTTSMPTIQNRSPKPLNNEYRPESTNSRFNSPISANAAKKRKKRNKRAPISILDEEVEAELNDDAAMDGD